MSYRSKGVPRTCLWGGRQTIRSSSDELSCVTEARKATLVSLMPDGALTSQNKTDELCSGINVAIARSALELLRYGLPPMEIFNIAKQCHSSTVELSKDAVQIFARNIRAPLIAKSSKAAAPQILVAYVGTFQAAAEVVSLHFDKEFSRPTYSQAHNIGTELEFQLRAKRLIEGND